jgi:tetratricopeptide (TPR) repeat protein
MKFHSCLRFKAIPIPRLLGVGLVLVTLAVLGPVLRHDFVAWDDDQHVYANPRFQSLTWSQVGTFWSAPYAGLYIPLTYTAWAMIVWLSQAFCAGELNPSLFHGLNLILHVGSVLVVYRIGLLIWNHNPTAFSDHVPWAAAVGAVVFGLHPLQVEAVAWVSGLKDVLSGWWALVAVWQYLAYVHTSQPGKRRLHYAVATGAFGFALLAKPAAVVVPVIGWLLAIGGMGQSWRAATRSVAIWLGLAVMWGVGTKGLQPDTAMNFIVPLWSRSLIAADALTFYLGKLFWPLSLGSDYGRSPLLVLRQGWWFLTAGVPVVLGIGLWWGRQRCKGIGLGASIFTAALLPILGWVPFFFQGYSTVADRYTYLALVGPGLAVGWGVLRVRHAQFVAIVAGLLLVLCGWQSFQQVQIWQSTMTLFTHALQVNPQSALAHNKIGTVFAQQERFAEAITHYSQALQLNPHYATVYNNLGLVMLQQGKPEEAIRHYTKALELKADFVAAYSNLGFALAEQGRPAEALAQYYKALQLHPGSAEVHYNLANLLRRQGQFQEALTHYTRAVQLRPNWAEAHNNLGSTLDDLGRVTEAIVHYQQALAHRPTFAEAHNNFGDALLKQGRSAEALGQFQTAVHLRPTWAEAYYNLGVAAIHQGQPLKALAAYRAALRLRPGWAQAALPLAWLLLAQTPPSQVDAIEAVALAEQACQATDYHDAAALHTLAMAYRATGALPLARTTANQALELATTTGQRELAAQIVRQFSELIPKAPPHAFP